MDVSQAYRVIGVAIVDRFVSDVDSGRICLQNQDTCFMAKILAAQINQLPEDPALRAALEYLCSESNKLYNCTVYLARQLYFRRCIVAG